MTRTPTGLKGSEFLQFGPSHSAEKFAFGRAKACAGSASEIPRHSEFGRSRSKINANNIPSSASSQKGAFEERRDPAYSGEAALADKPGSLGEAQIAARPWAAQRGTRLLLRSRGEHGASCR